MFWKFKKRIDVALVVGHRKSATGSYNNSLRVREFDLNEKEAHKVKVILDDMGITSEVIYRDDKLYYGYKLLPHQINTRKPKIVVSFHHNAFDTQANGTETLYYETSILGLNLATCIHSKVTEVLRFRDRGLKGKSVEDNGGTILKYTKAPCVILEPCFLDNTEELKKFIPKIDAYCNAVADGILDYLNNI